MPDSMLELLHSHRSIRAYRPDPLPRDIVEAIVAAGQRASTSSNLQTYCVVAVTAEATRHELAHLCGDQEHIRQAPVFLAWCADLSKLGRACEMRGLPHAHDDVESFLMSAVDVALVMQNAAVAAESLGLGMCYIGGLRNRPRDVVRLLHLPHLVFPVCGMTLGWPAAQPMLRPRLPLDAVLHWETHDRSDEDVLLRDYDRAMAATGIYDQRQVPAPGRPGETENYGWLEHSARRVSRISRPDLDQALREQGFLEDRG